MPSEASVPVSTKERRGVAGGVVSAGTCGVSVLEPVGAEGAVPPPALSVSLPALSVLGVCGVSLLGPVGAEGVSPLLLTFWPSTCLCSLESWLSVVWLPVAWSWAVWASVVWSLRDVICRRGAWPTWMVKSVALLTGRKEFLFQLVSLYQTSSAMSRRRRRRRRRLKASVPTLSIATGCRQ